MFTSVFADVIYLLYFWKKSIKNICSASFLIKSLLNIGP